MTHPGIFCIWFSAAILSPFDAGKMTTFLVDTLVHRRHASHPNKDIQIYPNLLNPRGWEESTTE